MTESLRDAFVLGCQRSGTTMLRLVFGSHPDVDSIDEAAAYGHLSGRARLEDPGGRADRLRVFKVPRLTEQLLEDPVVDDSFGTFPGFYEKRSPAVFLVRDPRDVAQSMIRLKDGAEGTSWIARWGERILEHRVEHLAWFRRAWGGAVETLRRRGYPPHETAAVYWCLKNARLEAYLDAGLPILVVPYEDLTRSPEVWLQRIAEHFDIRFDDAMLAHDRTRHDQLEPNGLAIGGTDPTRPIDPSGVGRYAAVFDDEQVAAIEGIVGGVWERVRGLCS